MRAGLLTTPLFGYDTRASPELYLYRMLSLRVMTEARRLGMVCHASGGAGEFKQARGAVSTVEVCMVHCSHLPLWRRLPWLMLWALLWNGLVRWLKLPGGPRAPVPPIARP